MNERLKVRTLNENDMISVIQLDDLSGNYLEQWIEDNEDYSWGLFLDNVLIGYCSTGYADDCGRIIETYNGYTHDALLLGDVFIIPEFRHKGYATYFIEEVLKLRNPNDKELVFLMYMYDSLKKFYEKMGFQHIEDNVMVRDL